MTTMTPDTAISEAFAPDLTALKAADELAARIATGKLGKADTPVAIRAVFYAADFDEEGAAAEVARHHAIIAAHLEIAQGDQAQIARAEVDRRKEELTREFEEVRRRHQAKLDALPDTFNAADGRHARRRLQTSLLPPYVQTELTRISAELRTLAPHVQRLEQLAPFRPVPIDASLLNEITTISGRRQERQRGERRNADGKKQHENLVRWLQDHKNQARRLHGQERELRELYL